MKPFYHNKRGNPFFEARLVYALNEHNKLWQIALELQPGELEQTELLVIQATCRQALKQLGRKRWVEFFTLAAALQMTPSTLYKLRHRKDLLVEKQGVYVPSLRTLLTQKVLSPANP